MWKHLWWLYIVSLWTQYTVISVKLHKINSWILSCVIYCKLLFVANKTSHSVGNPACSYSINICTLMWKCSLHHAASGAHLSGADPNGGSLHACILKCITVEAGLMRPPTKAWEDVSSAQINRLVLSKPTAERKESSSLYAHLPRRPHGTLMRFLSLYSLWFLFSFY